MPTQQVAQVAPRSRKEWRAWLARNHARAPEVWLIFHKLHTGASTLTYNDAIEEALCFGWIDGVKRRLDERRYMHRLSPRKPGSKWSALNKKRAEKMLAADLIMPAGLRVIDEAKRTGRWSASPPRPSAASTPTEFDAHLTRHKKAAAFFATLAPSYQRQYRGWIAAARREETRARRIQEAISLLAAGEKLGMR